MFDIMNEDNSSHIGDNLDIKTEFQVLQEMNRDIIYGIKTLTDMLLTIHPQLYKMLDNPTKDQANIVVNADPHMLKHIRFELQTELMCLNVVKQYGILLKWCCPDYKTFDVCLESVRSNPLAIEHVKPEYIYEIFKRLIDKDQSNPALKIMAPKLFPEQREYVIEHCDVCNVINNLPNLTFNEVSELIKREPCAIRYVLISDNCNFDERETDKLKQLAIFTNLEALEYCKTRSDVFFAIDMWVKFRPFKLIKMITDDSWWTSSKKKFVERYIELCPSKDWRDNEEFVPRLSLKIRWMCWRKSHGKYPNQT